MAILILMKGLPAAPFADAIRTLDPSIEVWTDADEAPPDQVEAVLAWRLRPGALAPFSNLRVLCSSGAGVDKLPLSDLAPGVVVSRVVDPEQAAQIAQYVLACTLQFTRELPRYAAQQARAEWLRHAVRPTAQCRVGILGYGSVGRAIGAAFGAIGYAASAWVRQPRSAEAVPLHSGPEGLRRLLAQSDIVVNALPLTDATQGLLNHDTLALMPRGGFVVNVGRGAHLVEDDLRQLLDSGHLGGAALDVQQTEPPPAEHWLWSHPKVVVTPHIAAQSSSETVAAQCLDALIRAREGRPQPRAVDRVAGY